MCVVLFKSFFGAFSFSILKNFFSFGYFNFFDNIGIVVFLWWNICKFSGFLFVGLMILVNDVMIVMFWLFSMCVFGAF